MSRPTLYLANLSSRQLHGPGRRLCAMARPRLWERGDGQCLDAAPDLADLLAVQRTADLAKYRTACEARWGNLAACSLSPTDTRRRGLGWRPAGLCEHRPVADGDTLFCACAGPRSKRRTHPCHLEILAPYLVCAGWDVVLWGRRLTWGCTDVYYDEDAERVFCADTGEAFDPADYGWPARGDL